MNNSFINIALALLVSLIAVSCKSNNSAVKPIANIQKVSLVDFIAKAPEANEDNINTLGSYMDSIYDLDSLDNLLGISNQIKAIKEINKNTYDSTQIDTIIKLESKDFKIEYIKQPEKKLLRILTVYSSVKQPFGINIGMPIQNLLAILGKPDSLKMDTLFYKTNDGYPIWVNIRIIDNAINSIYYEAYFD